MIYLTSHEQAESAKVLIRAVSAMYFLGKRAARPGTRSGKSPRKRIRRTVNDIYICLGSTYFRRAYRMSYQAFCSLHELLEQGIIDSIKEAAAENRRKRRRSARQTRRGGRRNNPNPPPPPNGKISTSTRLACALRYFAGGSPYDIMSNYDVSHTEMIDSVWYVVDAVNKKESFHIKYPEEVEKQRNIAAGFKAVSQVDFDMVGGAIDGILIWILKPSIKEAKLVGVDQQKFFCGRKHKFGLNCQAVCDVRGRFLDISIVCGGSSSDVLAFEKSELKKRLDRGLLDPNLRLFGENAYLNCIYMATPYPNTTGGPKDNYKYFHSQCRIRIECAFC